MYPESIQLWGDSVCKGVVFDDARNRYVISSERFAAKLAEAFSTPIENHSRMGATVTEGYAEFLSGASTPGAIAVIAYGGNDCDMPWKDVSADPDTPHDGRIPLPTFTQTLTQFVMAVQARGMEPLLVTPPPLDAGRYFDWVTRSLSKEAVLHYLGDVEHIYRWQERYSIAVRNVASTTQCALFDLRDIFLAENNYPQLLCTDGIHPNADGHQVIAAAVLQQKEGLAHRCHFDIQPVAVM